MEPRLNKQ